MAGRQENIVAPRFPRPSWDPAAARDELAALYDWAEAHTTSAVTWYLDKKRGKARLSRWLRLGAIVFFTVGGGFPVVVSSFGASNNLLGVGYLFLAAAAGCLAIDRFFGVSTAWMRYLTTELALQRALQRFQLEWAALSAAPVVEGGVDVSGHLELLTAFVDEVAHEMASETAAWVEEFRGNLTELSTHTTARGPQP
ncbi:MAG TPA: SLATT domain-containing protein [Pseudonocardiaceae bacterium]